MDLAQSLSESVLLPSPPNSGNTGQHLIPALLCSLVYQARWLPWLPQCVQICIPGEAEARSREWVGGGG